MKGIQVLLFFLLPFLYVSGQSSTDSLRQIWHNNNHEDTSRAEALFDLIYEGYYFAYPDTALMLADTLIAFNSRAQLSQRLVDAYSLKGYLHFRTGQYPEALEAYRSGLARAEEIGYRSGAASILLRTGYIYHDNEDLIRAISYYERSQKIFEEIRDSVGMSSIFNEFGSIYNSKGEYEKSLLYYQKAIALNDSMGREDGNAPMLLNMGSVYHNQEEYDLALEHYQKGLAIYNRQNNKLDVASGLSGIGSILLDQGNQEEAVDYLLRSLALSREVDDMQGMTTTLVTLGEMFRDQSKYSLSISHCDEALQIARQLGDIGNQQYACDCLYQTYRQAGNIRQALQYHELMLEMEDSMRSEASTIKLQQMEFDRQVLEDSLLQVEKDLKIEMTHQAEIRQKEKNRNLALGSGFFFLLLSAGFFSRWRYVTRSKTIIEKEKQRSENLLLNILPAEIAEELKIKGKADARDFDLVSILFTDFKGYTAQSALLSAQELVEEINECFQAFDYICEKYEIEKIKTIGDAYMAAGGLPVPSDTSVTNTILAALEMQSFITQRIKEKKVRGEKGFEMRVGIHTGPVVAGIVGVKKFQYDVWGDTVNTASRMESNGSVGKVNISKSTYDLIKDDPQFTFESRGKIFVKGKNEMEMWFVETK